MFNTVTAKLHTMRKPQEFVVMKMSDGRIMVQSDKSIGVYSPDTGKGVLSIKGNNFYYLAAKGFPFEFPEDFRNDVMKAIEANGAESSLGGGVVVTNNTVQVIE